MMNTLFWRYRASFSFLYQIEHQEISLRYVEVLSKVIGNNLDSGSRARERDGVLLMDEVQGMSLKLEASASAKWMVAGKGKVGR